MNNEELQIMIVEAFNQAPHPLTKEKALEYARELLKDYPRQMQYFGEWFEKNHDNVLKRANG